MKRLEPALPHVTTRAPQPWADASDPAALRWTAILVQELERRVAQQVAAMRGVPDELMLKHLVITDAEVDALLTPERGAAGEAPVPGSLAAVLFAQAGDSTARLARLQQRFGLSVFELDVVLVCLAPEIDRRFERLFAYLNDDLSRQRPTLDTLLRLLAPRHQHVLLQAELMLDAPLLRHRIVHSEDGARGAQYGLFRVADGIARYLLLRAGSDAYCASVCLDEPVPALVRELWRARQEPLSLAECLRASAPIDAAGEASALVINIHGRTGSGRAFVVQSACELAQMACLALDGRKLRRCAGELRAALAAAVRDVRLGASALFIHHIDALSDDPERLADGLTELQSWLRSFGGVLLLGSDEPLPFSGWFPTAEVADIALSALDITAREAAWVQVLTGLGHGDRDECLALAQSLASKFRLTQGEIGSAVQHARAALRVADGRQQRAQILHEVVARVATPRLHQLAEAIEVVHHLDDLVLPGDRYDLINDIVRRVRHRRTVLEDWCFDTVSVRGRGLVVLFHGASGTGKTMAADAIAHTLHMRLFRIDLAGVVSKYIGETEKNLRAIFDEANRADSVLFFDEADALFGKRSEVKDAHDRYANIEINYLLQRIESFDGIAILATNKRDHIDEAFSRRIHVSIEFPLPQLPERLRLWQRSFPEGAPLAADIDWQFLAQRFALTGGAIRNAALSAAYLAAEAGNAIGMREVVNAVRIELIKAGRRMPDSEFGIHAPLLSAPALAEQPARRNRRTAPVDAFCLSTEE